LTNQSALDNIAINKQTGGTQNDTDNTTHAKRNGAHKKMPFLA